MMAGPFDKMPLDDSWLLSDEKGRTPRERKSDEQEQKKKEAKATDDFRKSEKQLPSFQRRSKGKAPE